MNWSQIIDPFNNIALSALIAVVPILFYILGIDHKKMKGYQASLMAIAVSILIAVMYYGMPVKLALLSTANGALYGLFPICWIIISAVFLFNVTVKVAGYYRRSAGKYQIFISFFRPGTVMAGRFYNGVRYLFKCFVWQTSGGYSYIYWRRSRSDCSRKCFRGVAGKMISRQSIAVAAAAGNLVGKESKLFRFTVKHSFIMLLFICFIVLAQVYLFNWIIPQYQMLTALPSSSNPDFSRGYIYLLVLAGVLAAFAAIIVVIARSKYKSGPNN